MDVYKLIDWNGSVVSKHRTMRKAMLAAESLVVATGSCVYPHIEDEDGDTLSARVSDYSEEDLSAMWCADLIR